MIDAQEIHTISQKYGVRQAVIERDYVLGWMLWGIYNNPVLAENLVLKGGNCLRKIYFPNTRFSDDLDFSTTHNDMAALFQTQLDAVCESVTRASGIEFNAEQMRIQERQTPDIDCKALEARVYFRGLGGSSSVSMRIKFDISEYEKIVLPLQKHPLLHPYSDADLCQVEVITYSLEELLAEKLRSWIQRTRSRDLFDIVTIIRGNVVPIAASNIMSSFLQKTIYKQVPLAGRDEMLYTAKFDQIQPHWDPTILVDQQYRQPIDHTVIQFRAFINELFSPNVLAGMGVSGTGYVATTPASDPTASYLYNIESGIREAIIAAGRARQLVRLSYDNIARDIEPYSFRFKTRNDQGAEYFYGYDQSRGQRIKSFFLHKIEGVSILPKSFTPRWEIEF